MSASNAPALERPVQSYRKPSHRGYLEQNSPVPAAAELDLETLDLLDPEIWRQNRMQDRFERLRAEDPLHWTPDSGAGGYWSATTYADVMAIDTDHQRFSSDVKHGGIVLGRANPDQGQAFITADEPVHSVQRGTVQPGVAPHVLRDYEPMIRERTARVLDSLPVNEPFDWVNTVSIELTAMMLATLLDFPQEQRRQLTHWSDVTTNPLDRDICPGGRDQFNQELATCLGTFSRMFEARKAEAPRLDMLSLLAHGAQTNGLSQSSLLGNVLLLIVGGNDTTRNTMTGGIYALNKFPREYDKLKANPALIPNMVPEIIRWQTPLSYMRRTATEDVEMHGKTIRRGDQIALWYISANRDRAFWEEDPDQLIIDRRQARRQISFGFGIHRCLGNRLAELQLRVLWEEILKRFEHIEVLAEPNFLANSFIHGYSWMPVVCHPRQSA